MQALELQIFWDKFFSSDEYRTNLMRRMLDGDAAHMEVLLHHMVYGKPKETLALQASGDGHFTLVINGVEVRKQITNDGMVIDAVATPAEVEAPKELPRADG